MTPTDDVIDAEWRPWIEGGSHAYAIHSVIVVAALAIAALPVAAHHGGRNGEEEFELTGTVESGVSLGGAARHDEGSYPKGQVWDVTLAPGARTANAGLKEGVIPVGAQVTVHGHRSKDRRNSRSRPSA